MTHAIHPLNVTPSVSCFVLLVTVDNMKALLSCGSIITTARLLACSFSPGAAMGEELDLATPPPPSGDRWAAEQLLSPKINGPFPCHEARVLPCFMA
ncbi:hypothetical protein JOQ06_012760, partial [Pogonophryne albipinna]